MVADDSTDFQTYLQSVCTTYEYWWNLYTLTDAVSRQPAKLEKVPSLFDFRLMVQTMQRSPLHPDAAPEKTERLPVLEGLRKYAPKHVLLVGKPGSGKSTALARLLLEAAEKERSPLNPPLARGEEESESEPPFLSYAGGIKTADDFHHARFRHRR